MLYSQWFNIYKNTFNYFMNFEIKSVCAFLTPQYWSSLKSWGGTAVGSPALLLISSRSSPPTEMSTSSYWMLLLSRIRIISACWDFTWKATALIKRTQTQTQELKLSITTRNQSSHCNLSILSRYWHLPSWLKSCFCSLYFLKSNGCHIVRGLVHVINNKQVRAIKRLFK